MEGRSRGHWFDALARTVRGAAARICAAPSMAVVGKNFAVLERGQWRTSGITTWLLWALLHVAFLPQLQNRLRVQIQWLWSYLSGQRSSRLIPETPSDS